MKMKMNMMKKFKIKAFSSEEAKEKALTCGLKIVKNVTMSYKNADSPNIDSSEFKTFAEEMFTKNKLNDTTGVGLMVAIEPGTMDRKSRPWKLIDNRPKGTIEKKRIFEIRLKDSDKLIGEAESKMEAIRKAKELMSEYKEDMITRVIYRVSGEKGIAFKLNYAPSINTVEGTYVVFGNINETF